MKNIVIFLVMMFCLFAPPAIFTMIGFKSMTQLGKRPTNSAQIMISFFTKILISTVIVLGAAIVLLKIFAPK